MFSSPARPRLPITRDILRRLVPAPSSPESPDDKNVSAALRVGWAAMVRLGEIIYGKREATADKTVRRGDVSLRTNYAVLRLRHSKTDIEKKGVDILLAVTDDDLCPVEALRSLFGADPQPDTAPLFRLQRGGFPKGYLVDRIRSRLRAAGINPTNYSGYSLRRGAAQEAANKGLPEQEIQLLGRWKSNAVRLYYSTPTAQRLALSKKLQSDAVRPLPLGIPVRGVTIGGAD
jgi:integrase